MKLQNIQVCQQCNKKFNSQFHEVKDRIQICDSCLDKHWEGLIKEELKKRFFELNDQTICKERDTLKDKN